MGGFLAHWLASQNLQTYDADGIERLSKILVHYKFKTKFSGNVFDFLNCISPVGRLATYLLSLDSRAFTYIHHLPGAIMKLNYYAYYYTLSMELKLQLPTGKPRKGNVLALKTESTENHILIIISLAGYHAFFCCRHLIYSYILSSSRLCAQPLRAHMLYVLVWVWLSWWSSPHLQYTILYNIIVIIIIWILVKTLCGIMWSCTFLYIEK